MEEVIEFQRICIVVNFTPDFPEGTMPREIDQDELKGQLSAALQKGGSDLKIFGSRGGKFEKIPEGHTFEEAQESFDRHIIEMLFGEKVADMASTVQGRLALLAVVQNAAQAEKDAESAILTEVDPSTPTKQ